MFLRCERFDARKAAQRIVGYLDLIRLCFGKEGLEQNIRVPDLDERSEQQLKSGKLQILPFRDRSGRRVVGNFYNCIQAGDPIIKVRCYVYCVLKAKGIEARPLSIHACAYQYVYEIRLRVCTHSSIVALFLAQ